jgi:hypothetical protein
MPADRQELGIALVDDDLDAEELDKLAQRLGEELRLSEVDSVDFVTAGEAPAHTRGIDIIAVGGLLVTIAQSVGALGSVIETVQNWLSRRGRGQIKLQIGDDVLELSSVSKKDEEQLIGAFLARHAAS